MIKKAFIFSFLLLTFFTLTSKPLFAQEISPVLAPTSESTQPAIIKYDLAFPGILPDHPLYKLKVLRNRISLILISNPLKKIEFHLLQADKGLLAAAMLVDKNNIDLAGQTALKAEHNMTLISNLLGSSSYKQLNISDEQNKILLEKLKTASLKHQEVLNSLLKRVSEDQQKTLETVIGFSKTNIETIEKTIRDYTSKKVSF